MDITLLEYGCACSDVDDLLFCYEAVKEDFFNEISGEYLESSNDTISKSKIKDFMFKHKKLLKMCAVALVALTALAVAVKVKLDLKHAEKIEKLTNEQRQKYKEYKKKYDELTKKLEVVRNEGKEICQDIRTRDKDNAARQEEINRLLVRRQDKKLSVKEWDKIHNRVSELEKKSSEYHKNARKADPAYQENLKQRRALKNDRSDVFFEMEEINNLYHDFAIKYNKIVKRYGKFKNMKEMPESLSGVND